MDKKKDIQRCKFIIGCVFALSIAYLLGSIGDNEREVISNSECITKIIKGLFLLGLALLSNHILDKEVKKNSELQKKRPYKDWHPNKAHKK
jgi:hypothetical protein